MWKKKTVEMWKTDMLEEALNEVFLKARISSVSLVGWRGPSIQFSLVCNSLSLQIQSLTSGVDKM